MRFFIIMSLLLSYISCKKDTIENNFWHGKIDSNLYPYLFNTGSYWIYADSVSGNIDSTILTGIERTSFLIGPSHPGQGNRGDEEYFNMSYYSYYSSTAYSEQVFGYVISRALTDGGYVFLSNKQIGNRLDNAQIVDVIDSLEIENNIFRNVTKMNISQDNYINGNYNFYYADSVGVVKKEIIVNDTIIQTWNLKRYQISLFNYQ